MPYKGGLLPRIYPTKELKRSRIMEIVPDVWEIEGYLSNSFFLKPPSCNIFILRDEERTVLLDTGTYPYYRKPILEILEKFRKEGAKELVLLLSQGHFDHVANNDIIYETKYETIRFLLPEIELYTVNLRKHWYNEFLELEEYYDPYSMLPWKITGVVKVASKFSKRLGRFLLKNIINFYFRGIQTMTEKAEILPMDSRVKKKYGDLEFWGWELGRFFAIHDGTHTPGHLSLYDPKYKLFIAGDATVEINPAFFNSNFNRCIEMMGQFRRFAEQGFIELATDSHRSKIWAKRLSEVNKYDPLHPIQLADLARGKEECITFFKTCENYYLALKKEVLKILSELGQATVPEIVERLKQSKNPAVQMKVALKFPNVPSRLDVLTACVLKENEIPRKTIGKQTFYFPKSSQD